MYVHTSIYSRIVYCELGFLDCSLYDADVVVSTVDCNDFKDAWLRLFCLLDRQVVLSQRSTGIMHTSTCWAEVCCTWWVGMAYYPFAHTMYYGYRMTLAHPMTAKNVWNRWTKKHLECQVYVVRICVCIYIYIDVIIVAVVWMHRYG